MNVSHHVVQLPELTVQNLSKRSNDEGQGRSELVADVGNQPGLGFGDFSQIFCVLLQMTAYTPTDPPAHIASDHHAEEE